MEQKIIKCRIVHEHWEPSKVYVTHEDGSEKLLTDYFPDEISFDESEFVGLTDDQALKMKQQKDIAYLRS